MATAASNQLACLGVGLNFNSLECCSLSNLTSSTCQDAFYSPRNILSLGCREGAQNCLQDCSDTELLYSSLVQENGTGTGSWAISRYQACVNLPSIARQSQFQQLPSNISDVVAQYIPSNISESRIQNISSAVTDCLSSTCRNSRGRNNCYNNYCSPVKLLSNSSSPNVTAVNECLNYLCSNPYQSLPYADPDIVGIGVIILLRLGELY
jgi:hypothetical protein